MSKKDINFIRHIKPQIREKERSDKAVSRRRLNNVEPHPSQNLIETLPLLARLAKLLKQERDAP